MRVPGGGASCLGVGRPGSGALPTPTARPLGGLMGPTTHLLWVRRGAGVGTLHQPHSARSCELALRAEGAARGRPGGGPPAWVWGVWGRALSQPRLPTLWAGCRGPLPTGCGCGGLRAWRPVTNRTARALACCGGGMGVPGGGASCLGVGRPGWAALPPPTARPLSGLMGPTTHLLWGLGRGPGPAGGGDPPPGGGSVRVVVLGQPGDLQEVAEPALRCRAPPEGRRKPRGTPGGLGGPRGPREGPQVSDPDGVARQGADVAGLPGRGSGAPHHRRRRQQLAPPGFA